MFDLYEPLREKVKVSGLLVNKVDMVSRLQVNKVY
jgi:hypothetical protein